MGGKAVPSRLALSVGGQMLAGEPARPDASVYPDGTPTAFGERRGRT